MGLHVLDSHASQVPFLRVQGKFESATQALASLSLQQVDVIFLDIQMPDLSGLEMARIVPPSVGIVFTTAYPQFAVEGFELAVIDYLLKPIPLSRFILACHRALEKRDSPFPGDSRIQEYLFVKTGYDYVRIEWASLLYLEADDNYVTFHEKDRRTLTRMKLSEALEKLPVNTFVQVHKSYVISLAKIDKIERHQLTVGGHLIPVSSTFRQELLNRIH